MTRQLVTRLAAMVLALTAFGLNAWQYAVASEGTDAPIAGGHAAILVPQRLAPPPAPAFSGRSVTAGRQLAAASTAPTPPAPQDPVGGLGLPCGLDMTAEARDAAMVLLRLTDPCGANQVVVVDHAGLMFTLRTDGLGAAEALIPALTDPAQLQVHLRNGQTLSSEVPVPELADFDRVAIRWTGPRGLELHARERGADYGEARHIWHGNPGGATRAILGEGGFVTRLGHGAEATSLLAQIYTFPRDTLAGDGTVRLSVEVPIGAGNCGAATEAETLQTRPDGSVSRVAVSFTIPGCDAAGEYLVLQNLFRDLRIAAN